MQNCRDVAYLIASDGLEHSGRATRLMTRLHLLFCKHCRRYAREIAMIGRISREICNADSVGPDTVQRLEGSIMGSLSGRPDEGLEDVSGDSGESSKA